MTSSDEEYDKENVADERSDVLDAYYSHLGKTDHGIIYMGATRRKFISALQWISNIVFFVNGIMGLIDICMSPSDPQYYLYLNQASAAAAGYPSVQSHIGWIPYAVLIAVSLGFSLTAAFLELRCYSSKAVGLDLKWSIYAYYSFNEKTVLKSLNRAQISFSPHGNCYDNYYYIIPFYHALLLGLLFLHIANDFNILSFTSLIVVFAYTTFIILFVYMARTYLYPLSEIDRLKRIQKYQMKINNDLKNQSTSESEEYTTSDSSISSEEE